MADEKTLRIEFVGDDGGNSPSNDSQNDAELNEAHRRAQEYDDRQQQERDRRTRDIEEDARQSASKFDEDLANRIKEGNDEPLPTEEPSSPHQRRTVNAEPAEDDHPYYSESREQTDEAVTRTNERKHHPHSSSGVNPDDPEFMVEGAGGGEPPIEPPIAEGAALGGEGAEIAASGAAGLEVVEGTIATVVAALGEIVGPAAAVVAAVAGMAVAVVEVTELLVHLYDEGLVQFEKLNGLIAANRAQQNVELIQQRIETANEIAPSTTSVIQEETEWKKALIKLEGHGTVIAGRILHGIMPLGTKILRAVDWLVSWFTGLPPETDGHQTDFMREAEEALSHLHTNQGQNFHSGHVHTTRHTRNKPSHKNTPPWPF